MPQRDGYPNGVPCWVETAQPDQQAAVDFYGRLFGWDLIDRMPPEIPGSYYIAQIDGLDVAAVGPQESSGEPAVWKTYVSVESVDDTAAKVTAAGGRLLVLPTDIPAGRFAWCADPAGAQFGLWQAGRTKGVQLVNETRTWNWSELGTSDAEGAKAFYAAVFGWDTATTEIGGSDYTMWRMPGYDPGDRGDFDAPVDVIGGMSPVANGSRPQWGVAFIVDDVDAAADKTVELGGAVAMAPTTTGPVRTAVLADPQGAAFSVNSWSPES
jgi:uncharacterized protein